MQEALVETETQKVFNVTSMRVNLAEHAKDQAMKHRGLAAALKNLLEDVRCGTIIDDSHDTEEQERHRQNTQNEIELLHADKTSFEADFKKINTVSIPALKQRISDFKADLHRIDLDQLEGRTEKSFDRLDYNIAKYTIVGALMAVCVFYISAAYMALTRDPGQELATGETSGLWSSIFSVKAFTVFGFHWFVPLLIGLFCAGYYFAKKYSQKFLYGFIISLTAAFEFFIAYKIDAQSNYTKFIMGVAEADHHWYSSVDFWIVLVMGFAATFIISKLYEFFTKERQKVDATAVNTLKKDRVQSLIAEANLQIEELSKQLIDIETKINNLLGKIFRLKELLDKVKISLPLLERNITKIYDGWMQYISFKHHDDAQLRAECEHVKADFINTYIKN